MLKPYLVDWLFSQRPWAGVPLAYTSIGPGVVGPTQRYLLLKNIKQKKLALKTKRF